MTGSAEVSTLRERIAAEIATQLDLVRRDGYIVDGVDPTHVADAVAETLGLHTEEAVQFESSVTGKMLTLGNYTLPGQAREMSQRSELASGNPRVVHRWVSSWSVVGDE